MIILASQRESDVENMSFRKRGFGESKATSICLWMARKIATIACSLIQVFEAMLKNMNVCHINTSSHGTSNMVAATYQDL